MIEYATTEDAPLAVHAEDGRVILHPQAEVHHDGAGWWTVSRTVSVDHIGEDEDGEPLETTLDTVEQIVFGPQSTWLGDGGATHSAREAFEVTYGTEPR